MIDEPAQVGASLKNARESLGFSLSHWAGRVNLSKSYLSMIEQGKRPAPAFVIEAYEREARNEAMKRRTLFAALAAVPTVVGMPQVRDPALAEKTLEYGLWLGNRGDLKEAHNMYDVATTMADWVGHTPTQGYIRARSATRGIYEGWPKARAMAKINEALSISTDNRVIVESNAALVQIHTLAGDYNSARGAVDTMLRESKTDADNIRTAIFANYMECMIGEPRKAEKTYAAHCDRIEANWVWAHEAIVYQGMAAVRAGDKSGVLMALDAVKHMGVDVRMVGVGVTHLLSAVAFESPEVDELRSFARV